MKTLTAKIKVFGKIQNAKINVDTDGTVRVWDSVAGHYTACHSISEATQRKLRKLAGI